MPYTLLARLFGPDCIALHELVPVSMLLALGYDLPRASKHMPCLHSGLQPSPCYQYAAFAVLWCRSYGRALPRRGIVSLLTDDGCVQTGAKLHFSITSSHVIALYHSIFNLFFVLTRRCSAAVVDAATDAAFNTVPDTPLDVEFTLPADVCLLPSCCLGTTASFVRALYALCINRAS